MELPAEVTHYYLAGRRPFMSLSDLDELGRSAVLAEMADLRRARTQHRPFGARYMELRELTEGRLRELFEAAGGKPERKNPHYFVLGTSEWYERLAESMSAVSIPLADLPADQTTVTYSDSFTAMEFGPRFGIQQEPRPYDGKLFSLQDLPQLVADYGVPNPACEGAIESWTRWPRDPFIEIQLWSDAPVAGFL